MKKSILAGVLAALMLIAFTACEQPANIWNPNGRTVTNAVITQTGEFIEGESFDPAKFDVALTYNDGYTETISGTNVVVSLTSYVSEGMQVTASFGSANSNDKVEAKAFVNVYPIVAATISGPTSFATTEGNDDDQPVAEVSADDFTVSIDYMTAAGKQTKTLDPVYYDIYFADADGEKTTQSFGDLVGSKDGTWYTVKADVVMTRGLATPYASDTLNFKVVGEYEAAEPATWDGHSISVEIPEPTDAASQYFARGEFDPDTITVYQVVGGVVTETTVTPDEDFATWTFALDNPLSEEDPLRFAEKAGEQGYTITYTVVDDFNVIHTYTYKGTITTVDDYATEITASYTNLDDEEQEISLDPGDRFSSYISAVGTKWASGYETAASYPDEDPEVDVTLSADRIPADATEDYEVTVTYDCDVEYSDLGTDTVTIPVTE